MTSTMMEAAPARGTEVPRGIGLTGRLAVSWAVAGGILVGGFLVALLTLTERMSANGLLISSTILFSAGGLLGFIHGGALGYLGRGPDTSRKQALAALALAALYTVPAMAAGWVATGWISMTVWTRFTGSTLGYVGMGIGWTAGIAVVATAVWLGWKGLRQAFARWPDAALGTLLVAASFAALLVNFLAAHPTIWGLGVQVTDVGAVVAAAFLSLWVVGPTVTVALALIRRSPSGLSVGLTGRGGPVASVAVGLVVGLVAGLIALPFHVAPLSVPVAGSGSGLLGAVAVAVSQALVNEVLLRLVVMTGAVWLVLRWHPLHREEAALLSIVISAAAQLALYLPGIASIGFPSTLAALGYTVAAIILPALAFGIVYYVRGFATAVVADATALVALALLA